MSADETTDIKGRCVVNVIVSVLHPEKFHQPYLITSTEFRSTVNAEIIFQIITDSVSKVYSSGEKI